MGHVVWWRKPWEFPVLGLGCLQQTLASGGNFCLFQPELPNEPVNWGLWSVAEKTLTQQSDLIRNQCQSGPEAQLQDTQRKLKELEHMWAYQWLTQKPSWENVTWRSLTRFCILPVLHFAISKVAEEEKERGKIFWMKTKEITRSKIMAVHTIFWDYMT